MFIEWMYITTFLNAVIEKLKLVGHDLQGLILLMDKLSGGSNVEYCMSKKSCPFLYSEALNIKRTSLFWHTVRSALQVDIINLLVISTSRMNTVKHSNPRKRKKTIKQKTVRSSNGNLSLERESMMRGKEPKQIIWEKTGVKNLQAKGNISPKKV